MSLIHLTTFIEAPVEIVFDLSRSVTLHKFSMSPYSEAIIEGRYNGLLEINETVTWKARHLLKSRLLKVQVIGMKKPDYFVDIQVMGDFKSMKHEHYFKRIENGTLLIDQFHYELPYRILGRFANSIFIKNYLSKLLVLRNSFIKTSAECNDWKKYLNP